MIPIDLREQIEDLRSRRIMIESVVLTAAYELLGVTKDDCKMEFNCFTDFINDELNLHLTWGQNGRITSQWVSIPCKAVSEFLSGQPDAAANTIADARKVVHAILQLGEYAVR
jgi:hypothetical protein